MYSTSYFNPSAHVKTPSPSISPMENMPFRKSEWFCYLCLRKLHLFIFAFIWDTFLEQIALEIRFWCILSHIKICVLYKSMTT